MMERNFKDKESRFVSYYKDDSKKHKKKEHKHRSQEVEENAYDKYKRKQSKYSSDDESSNAEKGRSKEHKKKRHRSKSKDSSNDKTNQSSNRKRYESSFQDSTRKHKEYKKGKQHHSSESDSSSNDDVTCNNIRSTVNRHSDGIYSDRSIAGPSRNRAEETSESSEGEVDSDFTFLTYKRDLNRIFSSFHIVQDTDEFWLFVKEYEKKEKTVKRPKGSSTNLNSLGIPEVYDKSHRFNFNLNYRNKELFLRVEDIRELTSDRLKRFKDIILAYVDFKQKLKFARMKQLRKDQANLPVAQFKDEIIEAVQTERVVIIAGDTGCGKSTQVPQYLYQAGFGKIGKYYSELFDRILVC